MHGSVKAARYRIFQLVVNTFSGTINFLMVRNCLRACLVCARGLMPSTETHSLDVLIDIVGVNAGAIFIKRV